MLTSLQAIAEKAKQLKKYRFRDLYRMLNEQALYEAWREINKNAAAGVDKVTAQEFAKDLDVNIREIVKQLKGKRYKTKLVRRTYIPKEKEKKRPLGIPAMADKLVQKAAAKILEAIYEQDFIKHSYGYRPNMGAQKAVRELTKELQFGDYCFIVEADIKGYFDNINHDWLIKMLEQRIDDRAFIGLIRKWLKAGILDMEGQVSHPATGTPQGGIISPILANIYLHYVLDLWFEKVVKPCCEVEAHLCRYADDFVCIFRYRKNAQQFYQTLGKRLNKFNLELAKEKTKIISFSKYRQDDKTSFEFLGFEFRWGINRWGRPEIIRRTSPKKLRKALRNFKDWCRKNRNMRLKELFVFLNAKLRGYYNYYGLIGNRRSIQMFHLRATAILYKWLNRRSHKPSFNWELFREVTKRYGMVTPRITERRERQLKIEYV